jgi:hypothetical protein
MVVGEDTIDQFIYLGILVDWTLKCECNNTSMDDNHYIEFSSIHNCFMVTFSSSIYKIFYKFQGYLKFM